MNESSILINGRRQSRLDIRDRGLQYGDGLFETMAVIDGAVRRLPLHLARLQRGCERLGIEMPDRSQLEREIDLLAAGQSRAALKLMVTRGPGARGYAPSNAPPAAGSASGGTGGGATRILWRTEWPEFPAQWTRDGVAVRMCDIVLGDQPLLAGIKHLNRLEQVLARAEWPYCRSVEAVAEGLMRDARGNVVCATMSNIFVVSAGRLLTPLLDRCGVAGTMRQAVLQAAEQAGIESTETTLTIDLLRNADEVFLTNSLIGLWPVRRIESTTYAPGPLTRLLHSAV